MKSSAAGVELESSEPLLPRASSLVSGGLFALAATALALAAGLSAQSIAHALGIGTSLGLALVLTAALAPIGWLIGRRIGALTAQSLVDPMTHIGNRRHWEERMQAEVERATRSRMPLSLLVIDIDNLKRINDALGHRAGDRALQLVGGVLQSTCRSRDVAARVGGDELAVLLPRTRASEAKAVAERIRSELATRSTSLPTPMSELVTVSIGVAELDGARAPRTDALFEAADRALYVAKVKGKNRVETWRVPSGPGNVIRLEDRRALRKSGVPSDRGTPPRGHRGERPA